jgi:aryl-alcohol dehydrogenase-like predicted oxidoreductase
MEYVYISGTNLNVSRIALGTWAIGGTDWGGTDEQVAIRTIEGALDRGINLIDTAPIYGFGRSEEIIAKALRSHPRDQVIIATKCGLDWSDDDGVRRNSTRARVLQEVEASLRRLNTDYIDIYQYHWPDTAVPFEEQALLMEELRKTGKIRATGLSNYTVEQMEAFRKVAPVHTIQPPYNLFERGAEDNVIPYAREHNMAVLAYSPLCRGLLSGRINSKTTFAADDIRRQDPKFQPPRFAQYVGAVAELSDFARERFGRTVSAMAVRWVLEHSNSIIALWGARKPEQLAGIDSALGWRLDPGSVLQINAIVARHVADPIGAEFLAPPERKREAA